MQTNTGRGQISRRSHRARPMTWRSALAAVGLAGALMLTACTPIDDAGATSADAPVQASTVAPEADGNDPDSGTDSSSDETTTTIETEPDEMPAGSESMVLPAEVVTISAMLDAGYDPTGICSFVDTALDDMTLAVNIDHDAFLLIDGQPVVLTPLDVGSDGSSPIPTAYVADTDETSWIVQLGLGDEEVIGIGESSSWPATMTVGEHLHAGRSYEASGTLFCGS